MYLNLRRCCSCDYIYKCVMLVTILVLNSCKTVQADDERMECGRVAGKTQEFPLGINKINITDAPWHVGIYRLTSTNFNVSDVRYIYNCGGTIITPYLVISAAHCFGHLKKLYSVAAGNNFRDYYHNEEFSPVQKRNVSNIYVPSSFSWTEQSGGDDIAVIKLTSHFMFGESIRPVCIEFYERSAKEVPNGLRGNFVGWGSNEAPRPNDLLQRISMQTLTYDECVRRIVTIYPNYKLPSDKFCLYDAYGGTACRLDNGSGFVILGKDGRGLEYFSLLGVVSHSITKNNDCAENVVFLTNVQWFRSLIEKYKSESENEMPGYLGGEWTDCPSDKWQCDNGQCIDVNYRCDGKINCIDGSDEIAEYCVDKSCKDSEFRCTYGACVAGVEKCNQIKGCADGSDEMPLLCGTKEEIRQLEEQQRGNCSESSFQCKSGECIQIENICDGRIDCSDGSDETLEVCSTTYCPSFAFQCGYGACIKIPSKCDNIRDCHDGSDEAAQLCNRPLDKHKNRAITTTQRLPKFGDFCEIPSNEQNLIVTDLAENVLTPGMLVSPNAIVKFRCRTNYTLEGEPQNFCAERGWEKKVPTCFKYCPKLDLTKKISSRSACYYNDNLVPCNDRIRPGTRALLSCSTGFVPPPAHQGIRKYEFLNCKNEGSWDYQPYSCHMECGLVAEQTQEFSIGGNKVNITDVPWHVGIYFVNTKTSTNLNVPDTITYIYICGGTIITPNLVISAAHCFWDKANQKIYSEKLFSVAAGKYFSDYNSNEEVLRVQKRNISNIYVPSSFLGADENYKDDIAVIKLPIHLQFGESIRPVCIEFFKRSGKEVRNDFSGKFAGWGINAAQRVSDVLQSVIMQTLSYDECARRIRTKTRNYKLPNDKFCLYDAYGATACRGDSGGGFVVSKKDAQDREYFSLLGVISHGPSAANCAENVVIMTNVQWFEDLITKYKPETETRTECGPDEWQCDDGKCIDVDTLCNGKVNCIDGTDEIAEYCIHKLCKDSEFRCTYGACVAGVEKCNQIKGCADGSDEMPLLCGTKEEIRQLEEQQRGNCSDERSFHCKSGECIEFKNICDGSIDCTDGSDENLQLCSTTHCSSLAFQCGYGACIKSPSKCDNIRDCDDNSDEAAELCNRRRDKSKNHVSDLAENVLTPGILVSTNTTAQFRCRTNYTLKGEPQHFCVDGRQLEGLPKSPKSFKYCPKSELTKKISVRSRCYYNDNQVSCNDLILPGTRALLSCATGYVPPPAHLGITQQEFLNCKNEGSWDNQPNSCHMECGLVSEKTAEFSRGRNGINITEVPWHVGIYFIDTDIDYVDVPDTYIYICGGTIITPNLIISAAHCFWDKVNQKIFSEKLFSVTAGKYFREYNSNEEFFPVQKRGISAIYVPSSFLRKDENYKADIAVIKLSAHLKFGESIRPVCIEFETQSEKEVQNDWNGIFAGWGINEAERASEVLQSVSMQTLTYGECKRRIQAKNPNYQLPNDKFCLRGTACRVDSGVGFVISVKKEQNAEYFSLLGVVSHGTSNGDCAENIVIMTNVQWFNDLIEYHKKESENEL